MERLTEKITNKETGQVLAYRVPGNKTIKAAKKLGELEDLEEKGLLLKLPCKVGDTLYVPDFEQVSEYTIQFIEVSTCNNMFFHTILTKGANITGDIFPIDRIGKTVFFTKEEANIRLRETGLNEKK